MPNLYLGIPMSDITTGAMLKRWFDAKGWETANQKGLFTMTVKSLSTYEPPEGLVQAVQRYSFSFDLIHGNENAESVIEHVGMHASPEVKILYQIALKDGKACGVVRAKSPIDGSIVGTVIITSGRSSLGRFVPALSSHDTGLVGGIIGPVVPGDQQQAKVVLQGLILLGVRQNKAHGAASTVVSYVDAEERDILLSMGFDVLNAFEQLSMAADEMVFT